MKRVTLSFEADYSDDDLSDEQLADLIASIAYSMLTDMPADELLGSNITVESLDVPA